MGDTRDPESDQPAPKPGGYPVQAVLIAAIQQRMEFGLKKYGRPLETHNGRDPLLDMWEEMMDMISYFTQFVLEQGTKLPGLEKFTQDTPELPRFEGLLTVQQAQSLTGIPLATCSGCTHPAHAPGECRADAPGGRTNCQCGAPDPEICPSCRHRPHEPGRCRSKALNLGCGCLNEDQSA